MKYSIFVPGRLCIIGEHSDWASNFDIYKGLAICATLDKGIYATFFKDNNIIISENNKIIINIEPNIINLKKYLSDDYLKYIVSSLIYMIENYNVLGINININKVTLPIKKGFASSTAIILTVIKSYNKTYNLDLKIEDEMRLALEIEKKIGSKLGMMDTICAMQKGTYLLNFKKNNIKINNIVVKNKFYFVFASLNSSKNTIGILNDLHNCYINNLDMQEFLGKENENYVNKAFLSLINGNANELGKIMNNYQKRFDEVMIKYSRYLKSPILHKLMNDKNLKIKSYGIKGVGSQGDGAVQILAKSLSDTLYIVNYLSKIYNIKADYCILGKQE